jgi:hypothetical protein
MPTFLQGHGHAIQQHNRGEPGAHQYLASLVFYVVVNGLTRGSLAVFGVSHASMDTVTRVESNMMAFVAVFIAVLAFTSYPWPLPRRR